MHTASITLEDSILIDAPPHVVWPLLVDPDVIVTCVPGAEITAVLDDGTLEGTVRVKLGPTVVQFHGQARPRFDEDARTGLLEAKGSDRQGRTKAQATLTFGVEAGPDGGTIVTTGGEIVANGGLAPFIRTGGAHLARQMLADFGSNLAARVAATDEHAGEASAEARPVVAAAPMSAFRLLRRTIVEAVRAVIRRLRRRDARDARRTT